ncbi:xylulose kinase-1 [Tanacetum coccineum]
MANLEFCDKHNMVAYLKKPTGSEGFQEIVDFLNGSHIRYALTKNPTTYVSLIEKFWQTATDQKVRWNAISLEERLAKGFVQGLIYLQPCGHLRQKLSVDPLWNQNDISVSIPSQASEFKTLRSMFDALEMLGTITTRMAIDAYSPICDNFGCITEMAAMSHRIRERTDVVDAAGNTTTGLGKYDTYWMCFCNIV